MALSTEEFGIESHCTELAIGDFFAGPIVDALAIPALEKYKNALSDARFYCDIREYILYEGLIDGWMSKVVENLSTVIMASAFLFVFMWMVWTGLRIASGTNREPFISLLFQGIKVVVVMSLVVALSSGTDTVIHTAYQWRDDITTIITGSETDIVSLIDLNMGLAQVMQMIALDFSNLSQVPRGTSAWMELAGQAGPAILTSILIMISEAAIAVALMLAPLFLVFLLFKATSQMFWGWLKFLFGTYLAMAFVGIVASIALNATISYGASIAMGKLFNTWADSMEQEIQQAAQVPRAPDALTLTLGGVATVGIPILAQDVTAERIDVGSGVTRLTAISAMFAVLIVAVPPVVMQLFGAAMGYAQGIMSGIYSPMAGMANRGQQSPGASHAGGAPPAHTNLNNSSQHHQGGMSGLSGSERAQITGERYGGSISPGSEVPTHFMGGAYNGVNRAIPGEAGGFHSMGGTYATMHPQTLSVDPKALPNSDSSGRPINLSPVQSAAYNQSFVSDVAFKDAPQGVTQLSSAQTLQQARPQAIDAPRQGTGGAGGVSSVNIEQKFASNASYDNFATKASVRTEVDNIQELAKRSGVLSDPSSRTA